MYVGIDALKEGMIVDEPIYVNRTLLIDKGLALTEPIIQRIQKNNFSIKNIKISIASLKDLNYDVEWDKNDLHSTLNPNDIDSIYSILLRNKLQTNGSAVEIESAAKKIVDEVYFKKIACNRPFNIDLTEYLEPYNRLRHSIRVASLCVLVASIYNKDQNNEDKVDLYDICMAGLLHDNGKVLASSENMEKAKNVKINSSFTNKYGIDNSIFSNPFTYENIPIYTYLTLPIKNAAANIILYSNEKEDKTGPLKVDINSLKSNIRASSLILKLCTTFDDVISGLTDKNSINLNRIVSVIEKAIQSKMINKDMVNVLFNGMSLFPQGIRVELSNGNYAKVIESDIQKMYPIVITMDNQRIDLNDKTCGISITRIIGNNEKISQSKQVPDINKSK